MVTMKDVAERAGVSIATVSYVLNGTKSVSSETKNRVLRAVKELKYCPNGVAQSLRTRTTHVIGAIISDIGNPFFASLIRGIEDWARSCGYSVLICNTDENPENELKALEVLKRKRVDGVIMAPTGVNTDEIRDLIREGRQVVFVDRKVDGLPVPAVLSDNEEGAYQATKYLLENGHRRIGIVLGLPNLSTTIERLSGYKRALMEAGVEVDESIIVSGESQTLAAQVACERLLSRADKPTAIFATNNLMTIGVMAAIQKLGLKCPEDISVVGFDDFEWTRVFNPPITTVAQDPYGIGIVAAKMLLTSVELCKKDAGSPVPPKEVRVPVRLILRKSVKNFGR